VRGLPSLRALDEEAGGRAAGAHVAGERGDGHALRV
jgi:hypothetical protein